MATILVVDDRPINREFLVTLLGYKNHRVLEASDGAEALEIVRSERPDLVITDILMPTVDGYEFVHQLRADPLVAKTPVIFYTAIYHREEAYPLAEAIGVVEFLSKPSDPELILQTVDRILGATGQTPHLSPNTIASPQDFDREHLRLLTDTLAHKVKQLEAEVAERQHVEREIRKLNEELEQRVHSRTMHLEAANHKLEKEITERKRVEQSLRLKQEHIDGLNVRLQRAMQETHHRVKNNLQVVAALIDMQMMNDGEPVPADELRRLNQHIRALAGIHDLLTARAANDEIQSLSAKATLDKLLPILQDIVGTRRIHVVVQDIRLPARYGTSLSILVNEMISNAVKHGQGDISLTLNMVDERAKLEVCDEGQGFPPDFDARRAANTGLQLIDSVGRWDLCGEITYENRPEGGARVAVSFPIVAE